MGKLGGEVVSRRRVAIITAGLMKSFVGKMVRESLEVMKVRFISHFFLS